MHTKYIYATCVKNYKHSHGLKYNNNSNKIIDSLCLYRYINPRSFVCVLKLRFPLEYAHCLRGALVSVLWHWSDWNITDSLALSQILENGLEYIMYYVY